MIAFKNFLNKRSTFKEIFKKADECGLDSTAVITPANKILHSLKRTSFNKYMERKLSYIIADINFKEICDSISKNNTDNYFENKLIGYYCYGSKNIVMEDLLVEKIEEDCQDRKIIFISVNGEDYCLDREEEDNYCAHGLCIMLVPKRKKGYNLYYMNPHGEVMKDYTYFEKVKTRTRCDRIDFNKNIVDCVIIKSIVDYCNKKYDLEINYDYTLNHNYYGVNLQEEDNHGICFIFPSIIYYHFGKYFTEKRELRINGEKKILPSFKDLLNSGRLNLAIHSCFIDFNNHYKKVIFDTMDSKLSHQEVVEKLIICLSKIKFRILKNIANTMVNFITQDHFKKIK